MTSYSALQKASESTRNVLLDTKKNTTRSAAWRGEALARPEATRFQTSWTYHAGSRRLYLQRLESYHSVAATCSPTAWMARSAASLLWMQHPESQGCQPWLLVRRARQSGMPCVTRGTRSPPPCGSVFFLVDIVTIAESVCQGLQLLAMHVDPVISTPSNLCMTISPSASVTETKPTNTKLPCTTDN